MELQVQVEVERPSSIVRKLRIRVPAKEVSTRFQRGLAEVQREASLKGFRKGQAPLSIIKQYFGADVRHRVYHNLVDESFRAALLQEKIPAVGQPQIEDDAEHKTGSGEHDHAVHEDRDFTYTATVEVLPELLVKDYTGLSLAKESTEVTTDDLENVLKGLQDQQAELIPVTTGLVGADGKPSSRPIQTGDHVDMTFNGALITENGREERPGMSGTRVLEVGSDQLIPGFEDHLVGMRAGETKTFRVPFPADFYEAEMAGKDSEFTVTVNDVKEKKVPVLDDELAKQLGYEGVADLRTKAQDHLTRQKADQSDNKLRNDLVQQIIEKNPFDVPNALVESQTRALAQDWAGELKRQGLNDQTIQQAIIHELGNLRGRAESQVRASLLLEAIAKQEKIDIKPEEFDQELSGMAQTMKVDEQRVRDYYANDPGRREDLLFRLRQDRTIKFLLDKANIKSA